MGILRRHPLTTFFVLAVAATWAVWIPRALGAPVGVLGDLWTWTVAIVAVAVAALTGGRVAVRELFSRLVRWRVGWRWYVVAVLGPAAFALLTAAVFTAFGGVLPGGLLAALPRTDWVLLPVLVLAAALTDGLGEELGWRGFALPRLLARQTPLTAGIVLGVLWAAWHLPLLWTPGRVLHQHPFWLFLLDIVATSLFMTWVFLRTRGSVLIAVLLHAGLNVFAFPAGVPGADGLVLPVLTVALEWVVVAVVIWWARPTFTRPVHDPEVLPWPHGPPEGVEART